MSRPVPIPTSMEHRANPGAPGVLSLSVLDNVTVAEDCAHFLFFTLYQLRADGNHPTVLYTISMTEPGWLDRAFDVLFDAVSAELEAESRSNIEKNVGYYARTSTAYDTD